MRRHRAVKVQADVAGNALVDGERVLEHGPCWGAQRRERAPLVFARRRQYQMVLTDRRLLLFPPRPGPVQTSDLVIGKRLESFTLERVHRARPLLQLQVSASNSARLVLEFTPGCRRVGDALAHRLEPRTPIAALPAPAVPAAEAPTAAPPEPVEAPKAAKGRLKGRGKAKGQPEEEEDADPTFWGAPARSS